MSKLYLADPSGYDVKMNEISRHFSHKVEVYPPGSCPITMQISMLRTAANQTCGKCVPCRDGLPLVATSDAESVRWPRNRKNIRQYSYDGYNDPFICRLCHWLECC